MCRFSMGELLAFHAELHYFYCDSDERNENGGVSKKLPLWVHHFRYVVKKKGNKKASFDRFFPLQCTNLLYFVVSDQHRWRSTKGRSWHTEILKLWANCIRMMNGIGMPSDFVQANPKYKFMECYLYGYTSF
ncbi:hypothetical protein CEXT_541291 [Caerostris extrusa]|uniref:Maturase K n=1 Tax=Caerostris extrusa TaxID=172846 RepID=A0AAV4XFH9_CAEEX|nr:hypothetical protein CEXT_541291 [Caerostris extrusa]